MLIPEHWAEAEVTGKIRGRQRTIRRWGWSETSMTEASATAQRRASEAFDAAQAGKKIPARERKKPYGEEGVPIREEVIARNDGAVVTRNRYGARCLNEPDVWFGDVDLSPRLGPVAEQVSSWVGALVIATGLATAIMSFKDGEYVLGCGTLVLIPVALIVYTIWLGVSRRREKNVRAHRERVHGRIASTVARHPRSRFALYETPNGFRLLALHTTIDPTGDEAAELFRDFDCDAEYARICRLQACFRTRVSAKPWRIDQPAMVPRTVWPVPFERLDEREEWIERYEAKAQGYAACRFLTELGDGPTDPRCAEIRDTHDAMCRAHTDLPLA